MPNILPIMAVQMSLTMGYAILNAAGLSFIGLGVRPPTAEWGIMVAEGAAFIVRANGGSRCFPAIVLMPAVFCFNLLGDGSATSSIRSAAHDEPSVKIDHRAVPLLKVEESRCRVPHPQRRSGR